MRILAKGINYSYSKGSKFAVEALKNLSLEIEEGEFFGVIGHTGSGKSTFIQLLNGLLQLQEGELFVGDYDLRAHSKKDKKRLKELRREVGMVFQYPEYQLFAETVVADVSFGIKNFIKDISEKEVEQRAYEALETVGLDPNALKEKSPFDLSGGQKRRVALAGVIAVKPRILVLDEPAAGLDPEGKRNLFKLLHSLHGKDIKTIILVSHDMNDVLENCTKAAVFDGGTVVACDKPKELFKNADLIERVGLELPVTIKLNKALKARGIELESDCRLDDFVEKVGLYVDKRNI